MTAPPYTWRGAVLLKPDDHEFWQLVRKRVAQKWSWEEIAAEIGCDVHDLVHWANWVYQPPKKPTVVRSSFVPLPPVRELPLASPAARSRQFLAWRRATEGARKAREAMHGGRE